MRARRRDTGLVIAVAMAIMNVATYGFQMVAARALGPQEYGAFAALMNLMLVVSVMSLAVQATAARRISTEPRDVVEIERIILGVTYKSAAVARAGPARPHPGDQPGPAARESRERRGRRPDRRAADDHGRTGGRAPGRAPLAPAGRGLRRRRRPSSAARLGAGDLAARASSPPSPASRSVRSSRSSSATSRCGARAASTSAAKSCTSRRSCVRSPAARRPCSPSSPSATST